MDHLMDMVMFIMFAVLSAMLLFVLGIIIYTRHKGKATTAINDSLPLVALGSVGTLMGTLSTYWRAFGTFPRHAPLPDIVQLCGLGAMVIGFWVSRRAVGRTVAEVVAANGGTRQEALTSLLLHPGRSLLRLQKYRLNQAASAGPPEE